MKDTIIIVSIMAFFIAICTFAKASEMSIQIRTGEIRSAPSPLSVVVTALKYGDRLTVLEEKGMWFRVATAGGKNGWVHSSALTKEKLHLAAAGKDAQTGASGGEMALAGKGFTPQVEADFKSRHSDIDFTWIDKMAKMKVATTEVMDFLKDGGLKLPEGGAK